MDGSHPYQSIPNQMYAIYAKVVDFSRVKSNLWFRGPLYS